MSFLTRPMVIIYSLAFSALSACTTVDFTQVAVDQKQGIDKETEKNVVERSTYTLTSMFYDNGWCSSAPEIKPQATASFLFNGMNKGNDEQVLTSKPMTITQLQSDITKANNQIEQVTKAAEIYLVVADEIVELDIELLLLEAALRSSREAKSGFTQKINSLSENDQSIINGLDEISHSIEALKDVTNAYGVRTRSHIAARAANAGS